MRQARLFTMGEMASSVAHELNQACMRGETIVVEGSQGTHLSLALSDDYPHCTSDNCTTAAFADDVGLNWQHISEVVLVVKALPSRVGSGPLPLQLDSAEEDRRNIAEYGVRTGRRRRKAAGLSWPHLQTAVELNGPTQLALTFCDHLASRATKARSFAELPAPVRQLVVTLAGTLRFITRDGEEFTLSPGDVLLAEDTTGSGHQWQLVGDDPWRRIYIVLAEGADVPFIAD